MKYETEVILYFLIAMHTKNVWDWSFGHVKRYVRNNNAISPFDILKIIEESQISNTMNNCSNVCCFNCKSMLDQFFKIPQKVHISKYHVFTARSSKPGMLSVHLLSTSEEKSFMLLNDPSFLPIPSDLLHGRFKFCLLYTSPSPRDQRGSRMPSSA